MWQIALYKRFSAKPYIRSHETIGGVGGFELCVCVAIMAGTFCCSGSSTSRKLSARQSAKCQLPDLDEEYGLTVATIAYLLRASQQYPHVRRLLVVDVCQTFAILCQLSGVPAP